MDCKKEVDRMSAIKTSGQENQGGVPLHHTDWEG